MRRGRDRQGIAAALRGIEEIVWAVEGLQDGERGQAVTEGGVVGQVCGTLFKDASL